MDILIGFRDELIFFFLKLRVNTDGLTIQDCEKFLLVGKVLL